MAQLLTPERGLDVRRPPAIGAPGVEGSRRGSSAAQRTVGVWQDDGRQAAPRAAAGTVAVFDVDRTQPRFPPFEEFVTVENDRKVVVANLRAARAYVDAGFNLLIEAEIARGVAPADGLRGLRRRRTLDRRADRRPQGSRFGHVSEPRSMSPGPWSMLKTGTGRRTQISSNGQMTERPTTSRRAWLSGSTEHLTRMHDLDDGQPSLAAERRVGTSA